MNDELTKLGKLRVLVIDDDESIRSLVESMLSDAYILETAESAVRALETIEIFKPNIVVTDVRMPEIDGIVFLQQAKKVNPAILFIIVTGFSNKTMAISAIREGAYDFVEKPFSKEALVNSVKRAANSIYSSLELREARNRSVQSEKLAAVGMMAGSIIHELMNPIAIIDGVAHRMLKQVVDGQIAPDTFKEGCEKIINLVERVVKVKNSMRNMVRQTSEKPELCGIQAIIEDATNLAGYLAKQKSITIAVQPIPEGLEIVCRRVEISQIILNLLNNAIHAVESQLVRNVVIECADLGDQISISITDSGKGIPESEREKIFTMFYTTKPVGKGTGLGLSTSRQIALNHGGTLDLDPTSPATKFVLRLPKILPQSESAQLALPGIID